MPQVFSGCPDSESSPCYFQLHYDPVSTNSESWMPVSREVLITTLKILRQDESVRTMLVPEIIDAVERLHQQKEKAQDSALLNNIGWMLEQKEACQKQLAKEVQQARQVNTGLSTPEQFLEWLPARISIESSEEKRANFQNILSSLTNTKQQLDKANDALVEACSKQMPYLNFVDEHLGKGGAVGYHAIAIWARQTKTPMRFWFYGPNDTLIFSSKLSVSGSNKPPVDILCNRETYAFYKLDITDKPTSAHHKTEVIDIIDSDDKFGLLAYILIQGETEPLKVSAVTVLQHILTRSKLTAYDQDLVTNALIVVLRQSEKNTVLRIQVLHILNALNINLNEIEAPCGITFEHKVLRKGKLGTQPPQLYIFISHSIVDKKIIEEGAFLAETLKNASNSQLSDTIHAAMTINQYFTSNPSIGKTISASRSSLSDTLCLGGEGIHDGTHINNYKSAGGAITIGDGAASQLVPGKKRYDQPLLSATVATERTEGKTFIKMISETGPQESHRKDWEIILKKPQALAAAQAAYEAAVSIPQGDPHMAQVHEVLKPKPSPSSAFQPMMFAQKPTGNKVDEAAMKKLGEGFIQSLLKTGPQPMHHRVWQRVQANSVALDTAREAYNKQTIPDGDKTMQEVHAVLRQSPSMEPS